MELTRLLLGALALGSLLAACNADPPDDDMSVASAALRSVELRQYGYLAGVSEGTAVLVAQSPEGEVRRMRVRFDGAIVGAVAGAVIADPGMLDPPSAQLVLPSDIEEPLGVRDLFGVYRGLSTGAAVGIGGGGHASLQNGRSVTLPMGYLAVGLGVVLAFETLGLDYDGELSPDEEL